MGASVESSGSMHRDTITPEENYVPCEEKSFFGKVWSYPVVRYVSCLCGIGLIYYGATKAYAHYNPNSRNHQARNRQRHDQRGSDYQGEDEPIGRYNRFGSPLQRFLKHPFTVISGLYTFWRYVKTTWFRCKAETCFSEAVNDLASSGVTTALKGSQITLKQCVPNMDKHECLAAHRSNKFWQHVSKGLHRNGNRWNDGDDNAGLRTVWTNSNKPSYSLGNVTIQQKADNSWSIFGSKTDRTINTGLFEMNYVVPHWLWSDGSSRMDVKVDGTYIGRVCEAVTYSGFGNSETSYSFGINNGDIKSKFEIKIEGNRIRDFEDVGIFRNNQKVGHLSHEVNHTLQKKWYEIMTCPEMKQIQDNSAKQHMWGEIFNGNLFEALHDHHREKYGKWFPNNLELYDFKISLENDGLRLTPQERCMLLATTMFIRERCYREQLYVKENLHFS